MSFSVRSAVRLVAAAAPPLAAFGLVGLLLMMAISTGLFGNILSEGLREALATLMGEYAFWVILTVLLALVGGVAGHYGVVGAKHFSHDGQRFKIFSLAARINHFIAAVSCTTLILTGSSMLAAAAPGTRELLAGTGIVQIAWSVHDISAIVFACTVIFMLSRWAIAMLPRKHDIGWLKIAGGYLSKEKRPVPAHMFNAGQKMWFWVATLGGLVMATTGLLMHLFVGGTEFLNFVALSHHIVAAAIVVMYGVHLYMVLFAVKGSLGSMIDGYKSEEEVAILHSLYYKEMTAGEDDEQREGETAPVESPDDTPT